MDWDWAVGGITDETPRTMGPECENYMTDRRRWTEAVLLCTVFVCILKWVVKRIEPIQLPHPSEIEQPHSLTRLLLLIFMTFIFGIEMGFKLANRNVIYILNPCHIQTLVQIYLLAAKPSKLTIALFRIQMNNLNGPFLAFVFPEVESRTLPFEQATYWIQHAMLGVITVYILRTGAYKLEHIRDFKWAILGVDIQLIYCFTVLNFFSIRTGININKMLCADESDPFQGENYRLAAVCHESLLCPILNKLTVLIFSTPKSIQYNGTTTCNMQQVNPSHRQPQTYSNMQTTKLLEKNQPAIKKTAYFSDDIPATTAQIIRCKSNQLDYPQYSALKHQREEHRETSIKGDDILEPDDLDMEVIGPSPASGTIETINVEYRMPTTKID